MKFLPTMFACILLFSCTITHTKPDGTQTILDFPNNPGPEQAAEAYDELELGLAEYLKVQQEALESGNQALLTAAEKSTAHVMKGKRKLGPYLPRDETESKKPS